MNPAVTKFMELVAKGRIKDFQPIPNKVFSFANLEYLYSAGMIYLSQDRFCAVILSHDELPTL